MRFLSTLLAAFALGALIGGCSDEDGSAGENVAADLSEELSMLAGIVPEPDGRDGEQATVAGEVVRSGQWAFVLEPEGERLPEGEPALAATEITVPE